jgi:hypothetical protein
MCLNKVDKRKFKEFLNQLTNLNQNGSILPDENEFFNAESTQISVNENTKANMNSFSKTVNEEAQKLK